MAIHQLPSPEMEVAIRHPPPKVAIRPLTHSSNNQHKLVELTAIIRQRRPLLILHGTVRHEGVA